MSGVMTHTLYPCPITTWHYFYATLDVSLLDSDDEADDSIGLQPRYLIKDKVFSLFIHFQRHPVLQNTARYTAMSATRFNGLWRD